MTRDSVRMRLAIWNIGALALALLAFAGVVHVAVQTLLLRSIDRDLALEAGLAIQRASVRPNFALHGLNAASRGAVVINEVQISANTASARQNLSHTAAKIAQILEGGFSPAFLPTPMAHHSQIVVHLGNWDGHSAAPAYTKQWPVTDGYQSIVDHGQPLRVFSQSIRDQAGHVTGTVQAAYSLTEMHDLVYDLDWTLLLLIPPALLLAGLGGVFLTGRALRPVAAITQAAAALQASDLSERLPVMGKDEFAGLAATFNGLFGRLEATFVRLEQVIAQQKRFIADASHELRTPLTTIKSHADWARRRPRQLEEYSEAFSTVETAADRMARIVEDLLLMARGDHGLAPEHTEVVPMAVLKTRVLAALPVYHGSAEIRWRITPPDLSLRGDIHHLERLLVNLIDNAVRHTLPTGHITICAEEKEKTVSITVADNGEGIASEHLPFVCERFYRVDVARTRARGGTGLGLAICQTIVQEHCGTLTIESEVGHGTQVMIVLPANSRDEAAAAPGEIRNTPHYDS